MLSSGQRNALLLAPLLVLDAGGPSGFLLIDDPVHALDDLRVDHLARELARLADSYQVLVLTHDPRLEEHLRARRLDLATIARTEDTRSGLISKRTSAPHAARAPSSPATSGERLRSARAGGAAGQGPAGAAGAGGAGDGRARHGR